MNAQLRGIVAFGKGNEVSSLQIGQLSRSATILSIESAPQFQTIELLAHAESATTLNLCVSEVVRSEGPEMGGNPLPVKERQFGNLGGSQCRPLDWTFGGLDQVEDLAIIVVGVHEVIANPSPPIIISGHITIISLELLGDFLSIRRP